MRENKLLEKKDSLNNFIGLIWKLLITLSILVQLSVGSVQGLTMYNDNYRLIARHVMSIMIGLVLFSLVKYVKKEILMRYTKTIMWGSLIVLIMAKLEGLATNGSVRWMSCGPVKCQPSEFVKISVILWIAMQAYNYREDLGSIKNLVLFASAPLLLALVVLDQPDYGTSALIIGIIGIMLAFSRISFPLLLSLGALGLGGVLYVLKAMEYRKQRFEGWQEYKITGCSNIEDKLGKCWQILQSESAIGSGGLTGVGPGNSYARWGYLPSPHSDMVGSIIGEEYGFIGLLLVTLLYTAFILLLFICSSFADNDFDKFIRIGFAAWILLQTVFNLGGIVGLLPITGIVLPFISYGGSAMVANFIGLGLVLRDG